MTADSGLKVRIAGKSQDVQCIVVMFESVGIVQEQRMESEIGIVAVKATEDVIKRLRNQLMVYNMCFGR